MATRAVDDEPVFLDQLSTSQTNPDNLRLLGVDRRTIRETEAAIEEAEIEQVETCPNHAPYLFFVDASGRGRLVQGCCNKWECPRCGVLRAKKEYGRMVHGARELQSQGCVLYFATFTCRGKEMSAFDAEKGYGDWCNRLLTNMRTKAKRAGSPWYTAGVTERQKRLHPHSHMIVTFLPDDALPYARGDWLPNGAIAKHDCLYSAWFVGACESAGLGKMADYSEIKSPVAVAVYLGKYFFKDTMRTDWPRGWKRIRYSNSWPKLPLRKPEITFPLVHFSDWLRMEALDLIIHADSDATYEQALRRRITCVVPPKMVSGKQY